MTVLQIVLWCWDEFMGGRLGVNVIKKNTLCETLNKLIKIILSTALKETWEM